MFVGRPRFIARLAMLRVLLAAALILVRAMAPAMPMMPSQPGGTATSVLGLLDGGAICHAGTPDRHSPAPDSPAPQGQHDCSLCPACQLAGTPVLLAVASAEAPDGKLIGGAVLAARALASVAAGPAWSPSRPRGPPTFLA